MTTQLNLTDREAKALNDFLLVIRQEAWKRNRWWRIVNYADKAKLVLIKAERRNAKNS